MNARRGPAPLIGCEPRGGTQDYGNATGRPVGANLQPCFGVRVSVVFARLTATNDRLLHNGTPFHHTLS